MKKQKSLLMILAVLIGFLFSCEEKELKYGKWQERNDICYEINSEEPFTGIALGTANYGYPNRYNYKDGILHGLNTLFHEDGHGQKKKEVNYKDGKKHGLQIQWHDNGQKKAETNFENGLAEGEATLWYKNGQMKAKAIFQHDEIINSEKWDENGNKIE